MEEENRAAEELSGKFRKADKKRRKWQHSTNVTRPACRVKLPYENTLKKNRSFCSTTRKNFGMDAVSWRGRVHCDHRKLKLGRFLTLPTRRYTVPWGKRCVGTRGYVGIGKRGRIEGSGVNWKHVRRPWHGARKNGVETNKGRERDSNINENNNELNNAEGFDLLVREAVGVPWNEGMAAGGRKEKTPTGVVTCCIALSFIQ